MNAKILLNALLALILTTIHFAQAQRTAKKVPVIGVLRSESPSSHASEHDMFRAALRGRGYVEGKNIVAEYRYAEGKQDRLNLRPS